MSNCKHALITGITGQDGSYPAELLLDKGYIAWHQAPCTASTQQGSTTLSRSARAEPRVEAALWRLGDGSNLQRIIEQVQPDEIYNPAPRAMWRLSKRLNTPRTSMPWAPCAFLRRCAFVTKRENPYHQASTSELYGLVQGDSPGTTLST